MKSQALLLCLFALVATISAASFEFTVTIGGNQIDIGALSLSFESNPVQFFTEDLGNKMQIQMDTAGIDVRYFVAEAFDVSTNIEYVIANDGTNSEYCNWIENNQVHQLTRSGDLFTGSCSDSTRKISWKPVSDFYQCSGDLTNVGNTFKFTMTKSGVSAIPLYASSLFLDKSQGFPTQVVEPSGNNNNLQCDVDEADVRYFITAGFVASLDTAYYAWLTGDNNQVCYWAEAVPSTGDVQVFTGLTRSGDLFNGKCTDGTRTVTWSTINDFYSCDNSNSQSSRSTKSSNSSNNNRSSNGSSNGSSGAPQLAAALAIFLPILAFIF